MIGGGGDGPSKVSARCGLLVCVSTWRRLRALLPVVVPLPTQCGVNSSVRYGHLFNLGVTKKVLFITFTGYIKRGKSNY